MATVCVELFMTSLLRSDVIKNAHPYYKSSHQQSPYSEFWIIVGKIPESFSDSFAEFLLIKNYRRFRICHAATETASHRRVAPPKTIHARSLGMNRETTNAKTNKPTLPIDEPAASTLAALLPRFTPLSPRDFFFFVSCFSMRVALAGKIAGKAKNKPPTPGPNFRAIIPARAVINPPKRNRTA
jgi:hypothetical protein